MPLQAGINGQTRPCHPPCDGESNYVDAELSVFAGNSLALKKQIKHIDVRGTWQECHRQGSANPHTAKEADEDHQSKQGVWG